jgi:lipopolysaccharide/colanic/teichoic acid biosynthesis glycosyltransferase
VRKLAGARLRATDWVGPSQDGAIQVLLPFTPKDEAERLAGQIGAAGAARGAHVRVDVQTHRPRPEVLRMRRRHEPESVGTPTSPDVRWEPRGVPLLLARPLPRSKRAVDLLVSGAGLVLLSPLLAVIALAILLTSGRPILFRQWRTGRAFQRFQILKFRTMRESKGPGWSEVEHLNEFRGPLFKCKDDPRVLAFGRFLRRTSLDELPQLWNVWRGDMTLLGPRALSPEPAAYETWQLRRFDVTPGLACAWQARHREEADFEAWMRSDLAYLDRRPSFWSDARLFLGILWAVVLCRGSR